MDLQRRRTPTAQFPIAAAVMLWLVAIGVAALLDRAVAEQMQSWSIDTFIRSRPWLQETIKLPGTALVTLAIAIALIFFHERGRRAAAFLVLCAFVSSINQPIKWLVGRVRPFKSVPSEHDASALLPFHFHLFSLPGTKNLCFPSGHATLAFATAAAMSILLPRWRWAFYSAASAVAAERVLVNAHWLSDCVAAAALGVGGVWVVRRLWLWWDGTTWGTFENGPAAADIALPLTGDSRLQRAGEHFDAASARRDISLTDRQAV